jgi:hypothetical protein
MYFLPGSESQNDFIPNLHGSPKILHVSIRNGCIYHFAKSTIPLSESYVSLCQFLLVFFFPYQTSLSIFT